MRTNEPHAETLVEGDEYGPGGPAIIDKFTKSPDSIDEFFDGDYHRKNTDKTLQYLQRLLDSKIKLINDKMKAQRNG